MNRVFQHILSPLGVGSNGVMDKDPCRPDTTPDRPAEAAPPQDRIPSAASVATRDYVDEPKSTRTSDEPDDASDEEFVDAEEELHDDDEDEETSEGPRKPRRAEIDPETLTPEEREELRQRVVKQVEFYFGDTHYPKDHFLLQHAKEDPEGYVDLVLVMAFKKMRRLTIYPAFVAASLAGSSVVGVSPDGTKLRRLAPVPKDYEEALCRTMLIEVPPKDATPESLKAFCSQYGHVEQVRIMHKEDPYPDDINKYIMKGYRLKIPLALYPNARPCALVEFKTLEEAYNCCRTLAMSTDWRRGLRASILYRKNKKKKKTGSERSEGDTSRSATNSPATMLSTSPRTLLNTSLNLDVDRARANSFGGFSRIRSAPTAGLGPSPAASPGASPAVSPQMSRRHPLASGATVVAASPIGSPSPLRAGFDPTPGGLKVTPPFIRLNAGGDSHSRSPLVGRSDSPSWRSESPIFQCRSRSGSESLNNVPPANVLRTPRGPDGTTGFPKGRGRPMEPPT